MAVILTMRAAGAPITTPMATAPAISPKFVSPFVAKVIPTATAMPATPTRLPTRAVLGEDNPLRARMKHTAATRYATLIPVVPPAGSPGSSAAAGSLDSSAVAGAATAGAGAPVAGPAPVGEPAAN